MFLGTFIASRIRSVVCLYRFAVPGALVHLIEFPCRSLWQWPASGRIVRLIGSPHSISQQTLLNFRKVNVRRNSDASGRHSITSSTGNTTSATTIHRSQPTNNLRTSNSPNPTCNPRAPFTILSTTHPMSPEPSLRNRYLTASCADKSGDRSSQTRETVTK